MADKEDLNSTPEPVDPNVDPESVSPSGSHAVQPAVDGVPADADEPTFRDLERMEAERDDESDGDGIDGDDADGDGEPEGEDKELVSVGAPQQERTADISDVPVAPRGRQKKDKATARQKSAPVKERRTSPITFLKESVGELQKVVYPTGQQLVNYFIVVLIFVLFIIAIVSALDLAFGKAIIAIFS